MNISDQHPHMVCTLALPGASPPQIQLRGLIDTGADVTVISLPACPPTWLMAPLGQAIAGVGGTAQTFVSQGPVLVRNPEGQTATVRPYITAARSTSGVGMFWLPGGCALGQICNCGH